MRPVPYQLVQVANHRAAIGTMQYPAWPLTDTFLTLLGATGLDKQNIFYEPNVGCILLQPVPIWANLGTAQVTTTGGQWRQITDRSANVNAMEQYSTQASSVEWTLQTNSDLYWLENVAGFVLKLAIAPMSPTLTHTPDNWYRHVIWPANPADGYTQYRVRITYGEAPTLEHRVAPDTEWHLAGSIPMGVDIAAARGNKPISLPLTVLSLGDGDAHYVVVWLGSEMTGPALVHRGPVWGNGDLRIEGKNGYCLATYADLRFKKSGYYISPPHPGPAAFERRTPQFVIHPRPWGDSSYGWDVTGSLETIDRLNREFTYRLTLSSAPLTDDEESSLYDYSVTSPMVKSCTVVYPPVYSGVPRTVRWQAVGGVQSIKERLSFDLGTGLLGRQFTVSLDNTSGQRRYQAGIQAARCFLGYQHTGTFLRGYGLANIDGDFRSLGADHSYEFTIDDLLWVLEGQILKSDLVPGRWCVYALVRLLLQHGGIVPDLQRWIPDCPLGPDPGCGHTKMPAGDVWKVGQPILGLIEQVRMVLQGWYGQWHDGQFRFEEFNWNPNRRPAKVFREVADTDWRWPYYGGSALNEIARAVPFQRIRSLRNVRNAIIQVGWDQETGQIFAHRHENLEMQRSLYDPTAPNYLGGVQKPIFHAWSGYVNSATAEYIAEKLAFRAAKTAEWVRFSAPGQPTLYPGDIIEVWHRHTGLAGCRYWLTEIESHLQDGQYWSVLTGTWTGVGMPPGA